MPTATQPQRLEGIDFVIDCDGEAKAVLIDLKRHRELWEDFYDIVLAKERESEPREGLKEVKRRMGSG